MRQSKTQRFLQSAKQALLGSVGVVLVAYVGYRSQLDLPTTAFLCLIVIVLISLGGRLVPAALTSIVAVLSVNYFFVPPLFTIGIAQPLDEIVTTAFLVTALVISRLVAKLRQSIREVEAAHEQLRLVIDTVPILLASTRPDGTVEFVNRQWRDFLGLSLEEFNRGGWAGALHPDDQGRFVAEWRAALESGLPLESEARMRRADGEYRWLLFRLVPLEPSCSPARGIERLPTATESPSSRWRRAG